MDASNNVTLASNLTMTGGIEIPNQNDINEITFTGTEFTNVLSSSTSGFQLGTTGAGYLSFLTSNTERARIDSDGLKFNGDTAAANALDDYEEGTWTPVLSGNTGESGQSYNSQNGAYTKVGSLVYCSAWVNVSSIGTVSGSYAFLRGLPFTVASGNQNYGGGVIQYWDSFGVNSAGFTLYTEVGTTYCYVQYRSSFGTTATYMPPSGWGTSPNLMFNITYRTDA
jgi:hypothetical protein